MDLVVGISSIACEIGGKQRARNHADCGHHVQIEQPDVVVNAIEKLLERAVGSSLQKEPPIEPGTPDPTQRAE